MTFPDVVHFSWRSLAGYRRRTLLMVLAVAIGVAAVVVLTSLGEGARGYVLREFSQLGTNLLIVFPGRSETAGVSPGALIGRAERDLTLDDALALTRSRYVRLVAPLTIGTTEVSYMGRSREVPVLGSTAEFIVVRQLDLSQGRFLPAGDPRTTRPVCVIGAKVRNELFGARPTLGEWVNLGDRRCRVVGVLAAQGHALGFDTDELVVVPVSYAQALFNNPTLLRILVEVRSREDMERARDDVRRIITERHEGEEDVTVISQDAVLATFDRVLSALTLAVGGIASISLAVAGILIMNVMLIAVSQRTGEIGLLKAVGASPGQIRTLFFAEAAVLSALGAAVGLILGELGSFVVRQMYPVLPAVAPLWAVVSALLLAVVTGVLFALLPARRAARLDAAAALARR